MRSKNLILLIGTVSSLLLTVSTAACGGGSAAPPPPSLAIVTTSLADGTIGSAYGQTVQASGGVAPLTWTLVSGALPHGLSLGTGSGNTVTISGTPDRVQASVAFAMQVQDAKGQSANQSYAVNINSAPTIAVTQSGAVRGVVEGDVLAFRGIPYAAPPVGSLRWRPPQPPANWSGIRDASTFGNSCPQNSGGRVVGGEDCLALNVFQAAPRTSGSQPVMVFFTEAATARVIPMQPSSTRLP